MLTAQSLLMLIALILFVLAAVGVSGHARFVFLPAGLAFLTAAWILPIVQG